VRGNTCHSNGTNGDGAGIRVNGVDCRIEGNNCSNSDRGIDVDNTGNMIICNTCSGNLLNYDLVAGNRYGPIINLTAGGTAAVAGSSAADTTNTTHPWANFAH
jgi:parallel beta-helix repeat protein